MPVCPICGNAISDDISECPICGKDLTSNHKGGHDWVIVGIIRDKVSADFARETLNSYDIPAVIFSKSGFLGAAGLPMDSMYGGASGGYEVSVPDEHYEETVEVLNTILGNSWIRPEE